MEGNWNGASGENKYQLTGKEWNDDFGLGMNDFGARWYDPAVARWGAIDPMVEKYINWTPYNYTANNPIIGIDPNGKTITIVIGSGDNAQTLKYDRGKDGKEGRLLDADGKVYDTKAKDASKFAKTILGYLNQMNSESKSANYLNKELVESDKTYKIQETEGESQCSGTNVFINLKNPGTLPTKAGKQKNAMITLAHELYGHGIHYDRGQSDGTPQDCGDLKKEEQWASHVENIIRGEMSGSGVPLRTHYDSTPPDGADFDCVGKMHYRILDPKTTKSVYYKDVDYKIPSTYQETIKKGN
jgi:RHS repeat-associated protein